jgi:hypothetical protein
MESSHCSHSMIGPNWTIENADWDIGHSFPDSQFIFMPCTDGNMVSAIQWCSGIVIVFKPDTACASNVLTCNSPIRETSVNLRQEHRTETLDYTGYPAPSVLLEMSCKASHLLAVKDRWEPLFTEVAHTVPTHNSQLSDLLLRNFGKTHHFQVTACCDWFLTTLEVWKRNQF